MVTSTISNVVFERLPPSDESPHETPQVVSIKENQDSKSSAGQISSNKEVVSEGAVDARKHWRGEGEVVSVADLLQHKQLQTATINVGDTGE